MSHPFEKLNIEKMHSGNLCLELTKNISWELFEKYAHLFIKVVDGKLLEKKDSVAIRIWTVEVNNEKFNLVFDDFPVTMELESLNKKGNKIIIDIRRLLKKDKGGTNINYVKKPIPILL